MSFCKLRRRTWCCLVVSLGTLGPGIHAASAQWSPLSAAASPATPPATGYGMTSSPGPGTALPAGMNGRPLGTAMPAVGMPAPTGSMVTPAQYIAGPGSNNAPEAWEGGTTQAFPGNYAGIGLHGATGTFGEEQAAAMCNGGPGGTCSPRRVTFGYYGPIWRKWPVPGPAETAEAERPRVFGAPSQPSLPDPTHESEIYVPPRTIDEPADSVPPSNTPPAAESPAAPAESPADPTTGSRGAGAPPALPSDLEGAAGPSLNDGAATGWEEVSQSLATSAAHSETTGTTPSPKRPMTLRRISQTRFASAGPTAVQEASFVTRSSDGQHQGTNPVRRSSGSAPLANPDTPSRTTGRQNPLR